MKRKRAPVAVIVGTRPEAIKMAPVILALRDSARLRPIVISTSQHRHLVAPALETFKICVDHDLDIMRQDQKLWNLSSKLAQRLGTFFEEHPAAAALVQGDTTSAFLGGLCAFYHHIPVGHVEAGLRTGDRKNPFPEEMNRMLVTRLARWHFAPTQGAVRNLKREGIATNNIYLTGNTVVDAMRWIYRNSQTRASDSLPWRLKRNQRLILVTCHRRENFGAPLTGIAKALANLARTNPEVIFVLPVHPNPRIQQTVRAVLSRVDNVILTKPLAYDEFLIALRQACLVLSDSGGVQEEATALGKRVLVLREKTERPEGIRAGSLKLVGTDSIRIERECQRFIDQAHSNRARSKTSRAFGDGHAASRVVRVLEAAFRR